MNFTITRKFSCLIKAILEKNNYVVQESTPDDVLTELISFLKPKAIDIPLTRIGEKGDGGYLVPNDFIGIGACLSPGSNKEWGFEKNLFEKFKIKSAIIDRLENKPPDLHPEIHFKDSWLGVLDEKNHISMETWLEEINLPTHSDLILQMDIEGSEYDILAALSTKTLNRFRIIVVEFHYSYRYLNKELFMEHYTKAFDRLKENHIVVHFHANNSCGDWIFRKKSLPIVFEITLIRKDRVKRVIGNSPVPHELDSDCDPVLPPSKFRFS